MIKAAIRRTKDPSTKDPSVRQYERSMVFHPAKSAFVALDFVEKFQLVESCQPEVRAFSLCDVGARSFNRDRFVQMIPFRGLRLMTTINDGRATISLGNVASVAVR